MTEHGSNPRELNRQVVDEFRSRNGRVGGPFEGLSLLLLTSQGRTTTRPHTTPVVYQRDDGRYLVFASNAGGPADPDWYRNLLAHPQTTIEIGTDAGAVRPYAAVAVPLSGDERDRAWERQCAIEPSFREYGRRTDRTIPVVALHRIDLRGNPEVAVGMGNALIDGHDTLRAQLADVRSQVDVLLTDPAAGSTEELHRAALGYCYGLQIHHIREDGAFSALEDKLPQLTPALDHLRAEHEQVEKALADLEAFLDRGPPDPAVLALVLDHTVTGLEEHFAYEEQHLLPAIGVARPAHDTAAG